MTSRACIRCGRLYPASQHCPNHPPIPWQRTGEQQSQHSQTYNRAWTRLSRQVRREQPVCAWPGCTRPTTEVDHIIPLTPAPGRDAGARLERGNLQGLCRQHHIAKTQLDKQTGATR